MSSAGLTHIEWGSDVHAPCKDIARLKEIVNKRFGLLETKYNYIFLPRIKEEPATFAQLEKSVDYLLEKVKKEQA